MIKNKEVTLWKMLLIRLSITLLLLSLSRWLLYLFNIGSFNDLSTKELLRLYLIGFRFDIYTLIIFNIPFIVGYSIPLRIKHSKTYRKIIDFIFITTNAIAISLNLIDVIYFRYLDRRMTSELFTFISSKDENQSNLIFNFITDFWFMFVIFFVFLFSIIILTKKSRLGVINSNNRKIWYVKQSLFFVLILGLSVIGIRGGLQLKPINLQTAIDYTSPKNTPLIINTPFSICLSSTSAALSKIEYFDEDIIESKYSPIHKNLNNNRFIKKECKDCNIVIIILESFGQEMIRFYNKDLKHTHTPFLDSLLTESLTFDGMANGRRSIEALPSILCGLPSLMATDYPTSRYAINRLDGIGSILKQKGYHTSFFHGGNNGTMSFNSTSKSSGFDNYYGRNEYNNDSDFDGSWGIYDDKFLQFTAKKLNENENPFAAVIFTLSSHHPYSLPSDYIINDTTSRTAFEKTIYYADNALKDFFTTISKEEWFKNTIFVITSDHVNPEHKFNRYKTTRGLYQIPIAFYAPEFIENKSVNEIAQHTDIGISLLSILNIDDTVFSFGRNIFDSIQNPSFICYNNNSYLFSDGRFFMRTDGKEMKKIFDIRKDKILKNNIYKENDNKWNYLDQEFKSRLQQYNNRMINNKLYY